MTTISFINMKGGVGKTTSVVEIATLLATEHDKKVLVIDLDPQTNATLSFMAVIPSGHLCGQKKLVFKPKIISFNQCNRSVQ